MEDHLVLQVDDFENPCSVYQCRICHEEEEEQSPEILESPCACSGTLKFAHRKCIQRWCEEKGNTTCEICLQKFEPGYTAPLKSADLDEISLSIRGSLGVPRENQELHNPGLIAIVAADDEILETSSEDCSSSSERSASCCRSVALTLTVILLVRQLLPVLTGGAEEEYVYTLFTLFVLRAGGVLVPFYIMAKAIAALWRQQQQQQLQHQEVHTLPLARDEAEEQQLQTLVVMYS